MRYVLNVCFGFCTFRCGTVLSELEIQLLTAPYVSAKTWIAARYAVAVQEFTQMQTAGYICVTETYSIWNDYHFRDYVFAFPFLNIAPISCHL